MSIDLWDFAQTLYGCSGVEKACLRLQANGADVCLLLTALWLEQRNVACTERSCEALRALAGRWQPAVITPLRQLRLDWRAAAQLDQQLTLLREQVRALELQAERTLLLRLQQCSLEWPEEVAGDWLSNLAGRAGREHRDALDSLRIAVAGY